jgi:hypothetical protein
MWVLALPSVHRKVTGTLPSAAIVRINSSCFKSGRWPLEICDAPHISKNVAAKNMWLFCKLRALPQ